MFWQRLKTRRALTANAVDHPLVTGGGVASHRPRGHVPLVIREPETGFGETQVRSTVTVAAVREGDAGWHPEALVERLAELAAADALLVVFGSGARSAQHTMVAQLRRATPRREVVAVNARHRHDELLRDAATVERLLDAGSLPVVVTPVAALHDVTAEIASYLRADRVLRVLHNALRTDLCLVWQRRAEPCVN